MKRFIASVLGVLTAFAIFAAGKDDYKLVVGIGTTGGLCAAPIYVAIEKGYFDDEKLAWTEYRVDTGQAIPLLTTGKIDVINNLLATLIQPIANGLEVKIPLGLHTGCVKVLVPPDSPIKTVKDLKGKRIGTAGMAVSSTVITQRVLASLGVGVTADRLEVEWVIYQDSDLPLALEKKTVDAVAMNDPKAAILESEGKGRVILDSATDSFLKDEYCCVIVARTEAVAKHPAEVAKFVRAVQRGSKFVQEHPEETAKLLADKKWVAGDPALNAAVLKTYDYRASVSGARAAIARNTLDLQRIGLVKKDVDAEALTKNTFVALKGVPDSLFKK